MARGVSRRDEVPNQYFKWAKDAAATAANWQGVHAKRVSDQELAAYKIGYEQGYLQAVRDLNMHGKLKE